MSLIGMDQFTKTSTRLLLFVAFTASATADLTLRSQVWERHETQDQRAESASASYLDVSLLRCASFCGDEGGDCDKFSYDSSQNLCHLDPVTVEGPSSELLFHRCDGNADDPFYDADITFADTLALSTPDVNSADSSLSIISAAPGTFSPGDCNVNPRPGYFNVANETSSYKIFDGTEDRLPWQNAFDRCAQDGARLMRIDNQDQRDRITATGFYYNKSINSYWVGSRRTPDYGPFYWWGSSLPDDAVNLSLFNIGQPDTVTNDKLCLLLNVNMMLFDVNCQDPSFFICQCLYLI